MSGLDHFGFANKLHRYDIELDITFDFVKDGAYNA